MNATARPIRVFQVATGNVGSEMIKRIATQPDLELIGVHCYSPEKIGKDAGELAGLAPNGVKATGTIEEIIAARPDVLTFHGVFPDEDLYVKVLEAGDQYRHHRRLDHRVAPRQEPPAPVGQAGDPAAGRGVRKGRRDVLRHRA